MTICSVPNCGKTTPKTSHAVCYEHWKASQLKVAEVPAEYFVTEKTTESADTKKIVTLSSTKLGEQLGLKPRKMNLVLLELGWIERHTGGWRPTERGESLCAVPDTDKKTGVPFVRWPEALLTSRILRTAANEAMGGDQAQSSATAPPVEPTILDKDLSEFRHRFPATHLTTDGHRVRSNPEMLIDNWLYFNGLTHAYERRLPIEDDAYCDFYLPHGEKVYIEYWGMENDPKYVARKQVKLDIYRKNRFNLIELDPEHIKVLDDYLPRELFKFGIVVE